MTCQILTVQRQQLAGAKLLYEVDVNSASVATWQPNAPIAANTFVRPTNACESVDSLDHETGFVYQNGAIAGQSGALEPAWPKTDGATIVDGSLTLTARTPPAAGQDTIQSVTWTQQNPPDATLTITGQVNGSLSASAYLGGGTSGNVYVVLVSITMASGAIYVAQIILTIL